VKFFFDNNMSPHLARAVRELCKVEADVNEVLHLRDRFPPNIKDEEWIAALAKEGGWVIISQDGLRKNDLERAALRNCGLVVFALQRQWAQKAHWDKAQNLVRWWPAIMAQSKRFKGGAALGVPWKFSGAGQFTQIKL
jgi:hypothetical protein